MLLEYFKNINLLKEPIGKHLAYAIINFLCLIYDKKKITNFWAECLLST